MVCFGDVYKRQVYWSAQTPEGGYDFTSFFDDIRPTVQQYDLACINQETIDVYKRQEKQFVTSTRQSATSWNVILDSDLVYLFVCLQ